MSRNQKDAALQSTRALPTADGTVTSLDFDLETVSPGIAVENFELLVSVPALTATHLPNADTLTLTVQTGPAATPTTSTGITHVITGAGGAGAPAQAIRFSLPSTIARYVNVKIVAAGGTGDMSAVSATLNLAL